MVRDKNTIGRLVNRICFVASLVSTFAECRALVKTGVCLLRNLTLCLMVARHAKIFSPPTKLCFYYPIKFLIIFDLNNLPNTIRKTWSFHLQNKIHTTSDLETRKGIDSRNTGRSAKFSLLRDVQTGSQKSGLHSYASSPWKLENKGALHSAGAQSFQNSDHSNQQNKWDFQRSKINKIESVNWISSVASSRVSTACRMEGTCQS